MPHIVFQSWCHMDMESIQVWGTLQKTIKLPTSFNPRKQIAEGKRTVLECRHPLVEELLCVGTVGELELCELVQGNHVTGHSKPLTQVKPLQAKPVQV